MLNMAKLRAGIKNFFDQDNVEATFNYLQSIKEDDWDKISEDYLLNLFRETFERVRGYHDFIEANNFQPLNVKSLADYTKIPVTNKNNYLRSYPLEHLVFDGRLDKTILAATSGSSGHPFYFPRNEVIDWQSSIFHEQFLRYDPENRNKSTLVINCFGMGVWIGGLITYQAFHKIAAREYPLTILTPGPNKKEIFEALKHLGKKFQQIILCGYPPFIKDVIDEAEGYHINWKELKLKLIFAAESFTEQFRDYIVKKCGITNPYIDTVNIYGSADLGTMAIETPLSILIRKLAIENKKIHKELFHESGRLPTLVQFNPLFVNFEAQENEVLCTGYNCLPLIRYAIGDKGGVIRFSHMLKVFNANGVDLITLAKNLGFEQHIYQLPFVYVYERTDLSTKLYGAIIYPEHIRESLQHHILEDFVTGKFTMLTKHDKKHNQYLEINLELKPRVKETHDLTEIVKKIIVENLLEKNAEYKNNAQLLEERVEPKVVFWDHEHPTYFKPGGKQKWVKNN
ncbi:MAG: hypothetical protein A3C85_03610 [Candidatus Doudnabacteria bacterium RIFCSPHIGHO2_02_FULL_48_21]|uniref:Phenylacetate--CoA ligase n=1 Tax=Candidatus Doudnabacteria bacterium RIFCSPLOWO2_02_FULL_48_13 TaxID=1817845 RepID=A0A1F5QC60_9BACT|nr:MAG: hypothetical protein A3K05_01970 [Candidatus Doudnabacteria bacterium RIFCSPHIGHO2_01_48_18]OGE91246.1 MAG: hypothetical protein A3F44_02760 [Candidatus Doudnabacteria bacterium RIFCSPHIGHO2_12_FULL_47_25]OGE93696.1 MAG: hypothetical protein A3C85_03610 [Candidatus Doudnabacteria bacterium RIFCSPHIGHO2_02_FULL_48_21]OGE99793.1 MAG: hypothetical protein A3J05_00790 [Candidatus Doudnabacteria bacterium RIFCSPLOWO2_02_FULL_48_13]OGF00649.1 MAG: hypothetical protein A3G07_04520 [Candidatus 